MNSARFWAKVDTSGECWLWQGAISATGYGRFAVNRKNRLAHRVVWEEEHGTVPDGLCVLHRCNVRACVRLSHLYVGTHTNNMQDRLAAGNHNQASKTHCIRGHEFTEENTYRYRGMRGCKMCAQMRVASKRWGNTGRQLKTHCVHGHEYTTENTYVDSQNRRFCRRCHAQSERRRRAKRAVPA